MSEIAYDADCIFCRIAAREIQSEVLHESDTVFAFRDTNPQAPVHILLIPKEHLVSIADIEDRLSRALVIDPTTLSGDKVVFGATVTLLDEDDKKVKYQLVGQTEADARIGRISYNSPLGRALIGRQKGDEVDVSTPAGDRSYEIAKIEFI